MARVKSEFDSAMRRIGSKVKACPIDCSKAITTKSPSAQSCVSCVPNKFAAAKADRPMISTPLGSTCLSRKIDTGTSTNIGSAPQSTSSTPVCSGRNWPTTERKFGTSDELDRLVSV